MLDAKFYILLCGWLDFFFFCYFGRKSASSLGMAIESPSNPSI